MNVSSSATLLKPVLPVSILNLAMYLSAISSKDTIPNRMNPESENPRGIFIGPFIACPSDKVEGFAGTALVINLGVENIGDFEFGLIIDCDG